MKEVIIPKLPGYLEQVVPEAIKLGTSFVFEKYGESTFDDLTIMVRPNARGRYYQKGKPEFHDTLGKGPMASISCKEKLLLYERKTLGKYKQGLSVGYFVYTACTVVHELTHHAQYKRVQGQFKKVEKEVSSGVFLETEIPVRPKYSEVETTANEIEFLKIHFPEWHKMLIIEEAGVDKQIKKELTVKKKERINKIKSIKQSDDFKIEALQKRIDKWEKKKKKCINALNKLNKKLKYYERKKQKATESVA